MYALGVQLRELILPRIWREAGIDLPVAKIGVRFVPCNPADLNVPDIGVEVRPMWTHWLGSHAELMEERLSDEVIGFVAARVGKLAHVRMPTVTDTEIIFDHGAGRSYDSFRSSTASWSSELT